MPINFSQFQENVSTPADGQFLVGYFNTAAGGERRTSLSVLKNAILGNTLSPLTGNYQSTFATVSSLSALWGTNFALTTAANVLQLSDTSSGSIATFQAATTARAGLMTASDKLALAALSASFDNSIGDKITVEYVIVAGGGGVSYNGYNGAGAGGYLASSAILDLNKGYDILVGAGGAGSNINNIPASNGSDTTFIGIVMKGGGYSPNSFGNAGINGGSGSGGTPVGQPITLTQGSSGGLSITWTGGGGGGAEKAGANAYQFSSTYVGGSGGSGRQWLNGVFYAGGGGGASYQTSSRQGLGGIGGGGNASYNQPSTNTNSGLVNTGGGGGGYTQFQSNSYPTINGGSGIVVLRYPGIAKCTGGDTYEYTGGYSYHYFFNSGKFYTELTPTDDQLTVNLLAVGGGGGGASSSNNSSYRSGGGAGGALSGQMLAYREFTYTITVGQGGTAGSSSIVGGNGGVTTITGGGNQFTALGGGGGGSTSVAGNNGGSGGGGFVGFGSGTVFQGNNGSVYLGQGGGGGGWGSAASSQSGGTGRVVNGITYAEGGDGYGTTTQSGQNGTGDGGSGPAQGGSGTVVIWYAGGTARATGGNISISNGFVYHTYVSDGTFKLF